MNKKFLPIIAALICLNTMGYVICQIQKKRTQDTVVVQKALPYQAIGSEQVTVYHEVPQEDWEADWERQRATR